MRLILFLSLVSFAMSRLQMTDIQKLDALITDSSLYDSRIPSVDDDGMSNVKVDLRIRNIWNIDQKSMDCKMNILLTFKWIDNRLANISNYVIPLTNPEIIDKIWIPEMFFSNSKTGKFHKVAVPNQIMLIDPSGDINLVRRYYVHFTCAMDFRRYPFDDQECSLEISHIRRHPGKFVWNAGHNSVSVHPQVKLPQFVVDFLDARECGDVYSLDPKTDCLKAVIHFRRRFGFFLVNVYVPSVMIVMVSWTGFWIDINSAPARISLSVTTLLTISTKASSLQSMTAEVSYIKAIDVWMGVCMGIVFFSLVEFVFANYLWRRNAKLIKAKTKNLSQAEAENDVLAEIPKWRKLNIDKISRILFPSFFAIFSLVYWIYYLI
uniref:Glycine receptor subunit alpha-3 n=1 Tax=Hemiscolopendra marginata TaxID=943146 RepID=A0A646QDA8_9MYRI